VVREVGERDLLTARGGKREAWRLVALGEEGFVWSGIRGGVACRHQQEHRGYGKRGEAGPHELPNLVLRAGGAAGLERDLLVVHVRCSLLASFNRSSIA